MVGFSGPMLYLENEGLIDWKGNEDLQIQYQAEARFLRAYFHFYLTRMFGEIPALDHTTRPTKFRARTPAEDAFSIMINDLLFCAEHGLSAPYGALTRTTGAVSQNGPQKL